MDNEQKTRKQNRRAQAKKDKKIEKRRVKINDKIASEKQAKAEAAEKKSKPKTKSKAKAKPKNAQKKKTKSRSEAKIKSKRELMAQGTAVSAQNRRRLVGGFAFMLIAIAALVFRMGYWQI